VVVMCATREQAEAALAQLRVLVRPAWAIAWG